MDKDRASKKSVPPRQFLSFKEAKEFARKLQLRYVENGWIEWKKFVEGQK